MRTWLLLICALSFVVPGCSPDAASDAEREQEDASGALQLSLLGVSNGMEQYRLRAATFDIQGTRYTDFQSVSTSVSSETDLDSPVARARLFYGFYSVSLRPDSWYLERITATGSERVERAVLLSVATQQVYVDQGVVSRIAFQFGVDGDLIDFQGGEIDIGIEIRNAPDAGTSGAASAL